MGEDDLAKKHRQARENLAADQRASRRSDKSSISAFRNQLRGVRTSVKIDMLEREQREEREKRQADLEKSIDEVLKKDTSVPVVYDVPVLYDVASDPRINAILVAGNLNVMEKAKRCRNIYQEMYEKQYDLRLKEDEKERAKILTNETLSAKGRIDLLTESYIEKRKLRRKEAEDEYEDFIDRIEGKFDIGLRRELRRWLEHEGFFMFSEVERRRDNADADSSSEFKDSP